VKCGAATECNGSHSGCRGTVGEGGNRSLHICYDDLTGAYCRLCASRDDERRVYYSPATETRRAHCPLCRESARDSLLAVVGYLLLACIVVAGLVAWVQQSWSLRAKKQLADVWRDFTPQVKLKILMSFYMVATKVDTVYEVELPPQVARALAQIGSVASFGFQFVGPMLQCYGVTDYVTRLAVSMAIPLVIGLVIVGISASRMSCAEDCSLEAFSGFAAPALLWVVFVSYPIVTNAAFDAFSCYTFDEGTAETTQWLKVDVAIDCTRRAYDDARALAWLAICIYAVGLQVVVGLLLFAARNAIRTRRVTGLSQAIQFLYRDYKVGMFWWELVEMQRRFLLVGIMVLFQGPMMQLVIGTLLSATFMLFQVQARPYRQMSDDFLASTCSFGLVCIFVSCTIYKYISLVQSRDVREHMSPEQQDVYDVNPVMVSVIVMTTTIGAVCLSLVLFAVQFALEGARLRREALASKARRLRYLTNDEEVKPPSLEDANDFHTFLSHVWGTGQDQMRIVKQRLMEMMPELRCFLDVDDLEDIGDLGSYIRRTTTVLVYCSKGYFTSQNCMREIVASTAMQKPMIALIDSDADRGGLSVEEVHTQLVEADQLYAKWNFNSDGPRGEVLHRHLFAHEPIEWNRIGHFQQVTMRLIAERLLPDAHGTTYIDDEILRLKLRSLKAPRKGVAFHICCSALNPGVMELLMEVSRAQHFTLKVDGALVLSDGGTDGGLERSSPHQGSKRAARKAARPSNVLEVTTQIEHLANSQHMLLYLTGLTWTRGEQSAALAHELRAAFERDVHVLLAHEMTGVGGQEARHGCEFGSFFGHPDGATPADLLKLGIYSEVAVPLKGGPWREVSMTLLAMALGMSKEETMNAATSDWLGEKSSLDGFSATRTVVAAATASMKGTKKSNSMKNVPNTKAKSRTQVTAARATVKYTSSSVPAVSSTSKSTSDLELADQI